MTMMWTNKLFAIDTADSFSLINATQILSIAYLASCTPDRSSISTTIQTVESQFIIKSIKNRVQNFAYHQKSISQFREKDGLVPCAEDEWLAEKRNASFLFTYSGRGRRIWTLGTRFWRQCWIFSHAPAFPRFWGFVADCAPDDSRIDAFLMIWINFSPSWTLKIYAALIKE